MIDARFSANAFAACGLDTPAAQELADMLADEIREELHIVILQRVASMIDSLNEMGHNLKPYGDISPGDIGYRDDRESESGNECKLRVGIDLIISCGYAHLTVDDG